MASTRHPKIKRTSACNTRLKGRDDIFFLDFGNHIREPFNDQLTSGWKCHTPTLLQNQPFNHGFSIKEISQ
jgi:hypothetical protein